MVVNAFQKRLAARAVRTGTLFLASVCLPWFVSTGFAAGYALKEYSVSSMGAAFAGGSAQSDGPQFVSYNPATSVGVTGWDMSFTVNGIYPTSQAQFGVATNAFGTPTGGNAAPDGFIKDAYEPGLQLRYRLSEDLTAGLSITAPWGLSTRYNDGWAGRYYALESKLLTVNAVPSLAYEVSKEFVLSAGVQVQYAKGRLSNAIDFGTIGAVGGVGFAVPTTQDGKAEFNAEDWGFGFVAGALWRPTDNVSVGASYRSEISHKLKGDVDFTLDTAGVGAIVSAVGGGFVDSNASTKLTTPAVASLGVAVAVTPEVSLLAEGGYTWWNAFDELRIKFANPLQADVFQTYDWKDAWFVSGGIKYSPAPDWTLRTGVAFDQSPTREATRDPRIPDADRTWLSFGVHHDFDDGLSVDLGYGHLFIPAEPIQLSAFAPGNLARGNLVGTTDSAVDVVSVQLTLR